jgi:hypothetical protein
MPGVNHPSSEVRTRGDISGVLDAWARAQDQFIGLSILPPVPVQVETDRFFKRSAASLLKRPDGKRASGATYKRDATDLTQDTYECEEYGLEAVIDDKERNRFRDFFSLETMRAEDKARELLRGHESRVAALVFNTGTFPLSGTTGASLSNEWDDAVNATPITDLATGKQAIVNKCGEVPNTLVLPNLAIFWALCMNAQVRESLGFKYSPKNTGEAVIGADALAMALGVQKILVPRGRYVTNPDSSATASLSDLWNAEYAFLCVTDDSPDPTRVCIGKTFAWDVDGGLFTSESYRDDTVRGDVIRVRQNVDEKMLLTECGYLFGNVSTI